MLRNLILITLLVASGHGQTPVIGGTCKLGTADVQIGGKQTQFFLKCETTADSAEGEGVWVVKSRAAAAPSSVPSVPAENTQPQQHPKARKPASPNICEQDNGARESEVCAVSATCLQAHNDFPSSYLQCDQTTLRWVRKSCQENFLFNFEQQTCIVPKRMSSLSRQQASGLVCTFSSCSNSNPCSVGTCNNGYCCSSGSNSGSAIIDSDTNSTTNPSQPETTKTKNNTKKSNSSKKHRKPKKKDVDPLSDPLLQNDFPIGPPGYGFPEHLSNLDEVLIRAQGDGGEHLLTSLAPSRCLLQFLVPEVSSLP